MAQLIKENNYWIIRNDWDESDVLDVAKNLKVKLTKKQVYEVMQIVVNGFDANEGISWYSIESAIDQMKRG